MLDMDVLALADDLSGAAEVASVLGARIVLDHARDGTVAVDLDTRDLVPEEAARRVRAAVDGDRRIVFKKLDSLLRGNVAAEVGALDGEVLVTPALPVEDRIVCGGVLYVEGVARRSVTELLPGVTVCDARTDADLDAIVAEALARGARLAGSGGLAAALGRHLGAAPLPARAPSAGRGPLVVVGTAEPSADEQIRRLGVPVLEVGDTPDLGAGPAVLRLRGPAGSLAATVAAVAGDADLVLTGGETARRVLDALGVTQLQPVAVIHYGAVQSRAPDGRTIVTRPGSFGGPDSLVQIVRALT